VIPGAGITGDSVQAKELFLVAVSLGMGLHGLVRMLFTHSGMALGGSGVMRAFLVVARGIFLVGFVMMISSLLVRITGFLMAFRCFIVWHGDKLLIME
jgi:hypothetical protein